MTFLFVLFLQLSKDHVFLTGLSEVCWGGNTHENDRNIVIFELPMNDFISNDFFVCFVLATQRRHHVPIISRTVGSGCVLLRGLSEVRWGGNTHENDRNIVICSFEFFFFFLTVCTVSLNPNLNLKLTFTHQSVVTLEIGV